MNYVRIPKARVGVLIGPKGEYKKNLEKRTKCIIDVDSKSGIVEVTPQEGADSLKALQVISVAKAIEIARAISKSEYIEEGHETAF